MNKMIASGVLAAGLLLAPTVFAQDDTYRSKSTSVEQDSNGNYSSTTSKSKVDANGDNVSVNTGVSTDANGNSSVSKTVKKDDPVMGTQTETHYDHTTSQQ